MAEVIDKSYFTALREAAPEILCRNRRCSYLAAKKQYSLQVWGDQFLIDPGKEQINHILGFSLPPHEYFDLFAIYYLLRTIDVPLSREWISEKDIPGGPTFFRGPHQIPTDLISRQFNNDLQKFKKQCGSLGGNPVQMADAAFTFPITPDIPVAVLYWIGDDDFSPEAKILYDRSVAEILSLDILFALAVGVCTRVGAVK